MAKINLTIAGLKEAKQDLADLNKEFEKVKDDPIESKKLAKQFNDLSKDIDETTEALIDLNKAGQLTGTKFDDLNEVLFETNEEILPLTTQISEMEDRLYQLAEAGITSGAEVEALTSKIASNRTIIRETDKQIDLLAENKGLAIFGTGLEQIGGSLLRLDFETAGRDAKALNNAVGSLSKIGSSAIKGLTTTVGQLSKAFIKMGVALLANPIFLIATAVIALIAGIAGLLDHFGLLQPILDAIAYGFGLIKDAINAVIQGIKDFLDWIGATNFALQDLAEQSVKNAEKLTKKLDKKNKAIQSGYDQEIRLANIAGEDTTKLEIKKQNALKETAKIRMIILQQQLDADKVLKKLSDEELQAIKDQLEAQKDLINTANNEIKAINAQADADQLKADQDAYQKRLDAQRAFNAERIAVERQLQDLRLELQEESIVKDIQANQLKYERLIEDTIANEKLLDAERTEIVNLLRQQQEQAEEEIINQANQKQLEAERKQAEELAKLNTEILAKANAQLAQDLEEENALREKANQERLSQEEAYKDARLMLADGLVKGLQGVEVLISATGANAVGLQKTIALAQIAIDTAKAISGVVAGAVQASLAGGPTAPFLIAGYIASGIGTVASAIAGAYSALKEAPPIGGSVSGGAVPSSSVTSTTQATPNIELFGQNNDANNLSEAQDVEQTIQVEAVVSETEVTATQNKIKKIQENATL